VQRVPGDSDGQIATPFDGFDKAGGKVFPHTLGQLLKRHGI
jgi:hypothetical protein